MKLPDVLKNGAVASGEMWFRPATWRRTGAAYVVKDCGTRAAAIWRVPLGKGPELGITPYAEELAGDWVIVTPDEVLNEPV